LSKPILIIDFDTKYDLTIMKYSFANIIKLTTKKNAEHKFVRLPGKKSVVLI